MSRVERSDTIIRSESAISSAPTPTSEPSETVTVVAVVEDTAAASDPAGSVAIQYPNVPVIATSRCGVEPSPNAEFDARLISRRVYGGA